MNNEIIYVSRVFALNQKELVVIPTSSFYIFKSTKIQDESSHLFLTKKIH